MSMVMIVRMISCLLTERTLQEQRGDYSQLLEKSRHNRLGVGGRVDAGNNYRSRGQSRESEGEVNCQGAASRKQRMRTQSQPWTRRTCLWLCQRANVCTTTSWAAPACEKARRPGLVPRQPCCSPCEKGLGLLFAPQPEAGSRPCLSRKLLLAGGGSAKGPWRGTSETACSGVLLLRLPEPRWAWGLRKPSSPREQGSEDRRPLERWWRSAPRRRAFQGTRIG